MNMYGIPDRFKFIGMMIIAMTIGFFFGFGIVTFIAMLMGVQLS